MSQFTFTLESVLQHRLHLERQAQLAAVARQSVVAALRAQMQRLNDGLAGATESLASQHLSGSVDISYLTTHRHYVADTSKRSAGLMKRLESAEQAADEATALLVLAARERRVLEILKEQHRQRWLARQSRRERSEMDDQAGQLAFSALAGDAA